VNSTRLAALVTIATALVVTVAAVSIRSQSLADSASNTVATTTVGSTEPPREFTATRPLASGRLVIQVAPGGVGSNEIHVTITDSNGVLWGDAKIESVTLSQKSSGFRVDAKIEPISPGHAVATARLSTSGTWKLKVTTSPPGAPRTTSTFDVPIGG
jgi:hypothetical protein